MRNKIINYFFEEGEWEVYRPYVIKLGIALVLYTIFMIVMEMVF